MKNQLENTPVSSAPQTFEEVLLLVSDYKKIGREIMVKNPGLRECGFEVKNIPLGVFEEVSEYYEKTLGKKASFCYDCLVLFANKSSDNVSVWVYSEKCKPLNISPKVSDYEPVLQEVAA